MLTSTRTLIALILSTILILIILFLIKKNIRKSQLKLSFLSILICLLICCTGLIFQIIFSIPLNINPIYFDYFVYIGTCFLPVAFFFLGLTFTKTKIQLKKSYLLLLVIPIISLLILWTNDYHNLFYEKYSITSADTIFGPYSIVHLLYTYSLLIFGVFSLLRYSIKNAGFFSKQSILITIGTIVPILINLVGFLGIPMTIYLTPISFTLTILFYSLAIFKFKFLSITPIALQTIVDKISDSYIVLNNENNIVDYNKTFLNTFNLVYTKIRNTNLIDLLLNKNYDINIDTLLKAINTSKISNETLYFSKFFKNINKYFNIEITSINSKGNSLGTLILFKDTTQHMLDLQTIESNQDMLIEKERLASLGQMIGGIAHNLKTPIMSISGAAEGLNDLINEYDSSIEDPSVNFQDHHDIAKDMNEWVKKIKTHTSYMSDVITAVKGQAVALSDNVQNTFTISELVKHVDILMKHELKSALIDLIITVNVEPSLKLNGNINSLVQVINNIISNAIQSYNGKQNENIEFIISKENNSIVFSIVDHGIGMKKEVQDKLFKEMITTKGKNGTGLGLFMSYSNIRAHFNGNITFESEEGNGTVFHIIIPIK